MAVNSRVHTIRLGVALLSATAAAACTVLLYVPVMHTETLIKEDMHPEVGRCYTVQYHAPYKWLFRVTSDTMELADGSRLALYEDNQRLGPAHSPHASIRSDAAGRFSHWAHYIYFAASDNSDPRTNGRIYSVQYPLELPQGYAVFFFIVGIVLFLPEGLRLVAWLARKLLAAQDD